MKVHVDLMEKPIYAHARSLLDLFMLQPGPRLKIFLEKIDWAQKEKRKNRKEDKNKSRGIGYYPC